MAGRKDLTVSVIGWAARDTSGHLSPFAFTRRKTGPKDVMFVTKFCGICHSDLHQIKNDWGGAKYPMVPGHEIVGIVTEVGEEVTKFRAGDRCGVGCMVNSCMSCSSCAEGVEQYCLKKTHWTYNDSDVDGSRTYGGYSNIMVVQEDFALKVPEDMPLDVAAPLLCAGITVYSPMKHYEMEKGGKNVGVIGLGGLGHMAVKMAKAFGMNVTVFSTSPGKEKKARANLGVDNFIISSDGAQMKAATATLNFIIDTIPAPHSVDMYLKVLKVDGKLIALGVVPQSLEVPPKSIIFGRKMLGGSLIGGIAETQEMLEFCVKHNVMPEVEKIPIDSVNEAMARLVRNDVQYRFVIDIENTFIPFS